MVGLAPSWRIKAGASTIPPAARVVNERKSRRCTRGLCIERLDGISVPLKRSEIMSDASLSRRDLLRLSVLVALPQPRLAAAAQGRAPAAADVYRSIGVKPLINARGTFTIIGGSLMLPEVR